MFLNKRKNSRNQKDTAIQLTKFDIIKSLINALNKRRKQKNEMENYKLQDRKICANNLTKIRDP